MAAAPNPAAQTATADLLARLPELEAAIARLGAELGQLQGRVAELEARVATLERPTQARGAPPADTPTRRRPGPRNFDPGDAVPPGVAVIEPEPLDDEAKAALDNLEHKLPHE